MLDHPIHEAVVKMQRVPAVVGVIALALLASCAEQPTAPQSELRSHNDVISVAAVGTAVYNNIPEPLPGNVPSQGFQCCQTAEVGDYVQLAGTARRASSAKVLMSSWALNSSYPSMSAAGYQHPITLNIYNVDNSGPTPALGSLIATVTKTFLIPWRPAADPTCPGGTAWRHSSGACFNGYAFTIDFDLLSLGVTLPDKFIFGVAFNTNTWGYAPIGQPGPYESLNVGTANVNGAGVPPSVGVDVEPGAVFWNTGPAFGGNFTFRRDDVDWLGYSPAAQFNAITVASNRNDCLKNGWQSLSRADGSAFVNQGDCVSYAQNGK